MRTRFPLFMALSTGLATAQIFCIQGITTTIAYEAALNPEGTSCPVNEAQGISYYSANSAGCCTSTATARTLGTEAAACCPCGALCTGAFPPMLDWAFNTADQLVLTPTGDSGALQTVTPNAPRSSSAPTPFHGPYTADNTTVGAAGPASDTSAASTSQHISTASPTSRSSSSTSGSAAATASPSSAIAQLPVPSLKACYLTLIATFLALMN